MILKKRKQPSTEERIAEAVARNACIDFLMGGIVLFLALWVLGGVS